MPRWIPRALLGVLAVLLLMPLWLVAQGTIARHTEIFNFLNGFKLDGGTTITGTTGTGTDAVVLPANSVGLGTEVSGFAEPVTFCGDLVNASTSYLGPAVAALNGTPTDTVLAGTACNALDSTTEATADTALSTLAVKVMGFRCKISAAPTSTNTVTFTLRDNAANAVTTDGGASTLSCTITGTATECRTLSGTTTNIPAGDPVSIAALSSYDASTADARCVALVSWP
jgi:hypothetical protein